MASGLAAQLAQSSSLNASLYIDRSRRKFAESYLFSDRDANQHDFYSLHALGLNGLLKLKALNAVFEKYESTIFADSSRNADRTLQSKTQNEDLDKVLDDFLKNLGPYLMEAPASKALEWVIRRFRANEFNVHALMTLFLPYHETPHFTKLVSILHIESDLWRFLIPLKSAAQSLPRTVLVNEMAKNSDLARFVFDLLPESLENGSIHPALIGFTAGVAVEYIARQKHIKEDTLAFILSTANKLCSSGTNQECVLVGYTIFSALSHQCRLKQEVLLAIIGVMLVGQVHTESIQFISFAVGLLAPQEQLENLPGPIVKQIMSLPRLPQYLADCLKWIGSEKLILALLPGLLRRIKHSKAVELLDSLLLSPILPSSVMKTLIPSLLYMCDPAAADSKQIQLLRTIYQNYPSAYSQVVSDIMNETQDAEKRELVENITRLVTLPATALDDIGQLILSSRLEEVNNRQRAVRDLIRRLKETDLDVDTRKDIEKALLDRVCDDQIAVIESLYESPSIVLPIFNDVSFIMAVSKALTLSDPPRGIMRLHFSLMAGPFLEKYPDFAPVIFENIFLPFILYTKPRQKTAQLVWDTLNNSPFASYELLSGCGAVFSKHTIEEATRIDDMAKLNLAIATQIAKNILSSNSFPNHLDMLLRLVRYTDAHSRNISYLISRFLLNLLSGTHQLEMAQRLFAAMDVQSLSDMQGVFSDRINIQELITDDALSKAIVVKPNSNNTTHHLQISILALIPILKRPSGVEIQWLPGGTSTLMDTRGATFAALMQDMYRLISTSTGRELSTILLKALFVNLREEALLLLVGIWVRCTLNPIPNSEHLFQTALFHTLAFLRAQVEDSDSPQDFQTIVPALLIALHSGTKLIRSTAMDCIAVIAQSTSSNSASAVYAVDTVYGEKTSANLQYLEWSDFGRFMTSVGSYRKHCTNDKDYLNVVVQDLLQTRRSDNKKDASYKKKVLCYLLSHVLAWDNMEARIAFLRMFRNVFHEVKLTMLSPILQSFVSADRLSLPDGNEESVLLYWELLLRSYDLTSVSELRDPSSSQRDILFKLIRASLANDSTPQAILTSIFAQLNGDVFGQFPSDLQQEYCVVLIESATTTNSLKTLIKENFGPLLKKADLIVSLLSRFQPAAKDTQQRASKRAKVADDSGDVIPDFLTTLAEILVAHPMPGSPELLSQLLDTLAAIHHGQSSQSDSQYTTQLFMTIIESTISSIPNATKLTPNTLRMEILIELLRTSDNPQTFNQALLAIASIAKVAPESVMQNVMPIFTFMGSNVFHRDDSYSFRVVQKTIDSIVPVVVDSLKRKHTGSFDLLKASTDFLRVFTDAATHVPRHRRTQFFIHFVDILGRDDFLIPVCLLLIEKSHRVVRQKTSEAAGTLGLPVAIIQSQSKVPPFKIIYQLLREATTLYSASTSNESLPNMVTFLDISKDETTAKMQINAIVLFVDVLLQQSTRTGSTTDVISINDSITLLLGIANTSPADSDSPQYLDISRTAIKALGHLLGVISVSEFVSSIDVILKSNNNLIEIGALNLLASRLANVSPKTRLDIAPTLIGILSHICAVVENGEDVVRVKAALAACQSIALSAVDQELSSLAKALPVILKIANRIPEVTGSVLKCIVPLSTKLGPRILSVFRDVVRFCVDILRNVVDMTEDEKEKLSLRTDAQLSLINILSSIPQFWTADDLVGLVVLVLEFPADTLELRKTLTKRVPSQQLLSALLRVWSRSIPHHFKEIFFDLLKRVVRNSERSVVHENLRDVFKLFLEAFEDLQSIKKDFSHLETFCLASFVEFVTKLNETTFKPLYRRLFDWAFNDSSENRVNRQITFCLALTSLIKLLKDLVTPYLDIALGPLLELLDAEREPSFELWSASIELLNTSLISDEGAFWKPEKLNKLAPPLVKQIENYVNLFSQTDDVEALQTCLNNLVSAMDDELSLKKLHLDILMQTRSEDPRVRLFTLQILVSLWESQGEKLTGFLTDIITFIVECAEDENDNVSKAARSLKREVEKRTGNLDALLGK